MEKEAPRMREGHENSWRGHNHDRKKEEMHTPPKGGKGENAGKKTDFGRCIFSLPPTHPGGGAPLHMLASSM